MSVRSRRWCLTLNNPDINRDEFIERGRASWQLCGIVVGSERGESGTEHFQIYLEVKNPIRASSIKSVFPRAHIEVARGTRSQNYSYCSKDGNFTSYPNDYDWNKNENKRKRNDSGHLDILRGLCDPGSEHIRNRMLYLRYKDSFESRAGEIINRRYQISQREKYLEYRLRDWQLYVLSLLRGQSTRCVLWCWDSIGGSGKSTLCRYLRYVYRFDYLDGVTRAGDIAHLLSKSPVGVVFDVTRSDADKFSYNTLERVKDGYVMSGKYRGVLKEFDSPPVVVFANFAPSEGRLSADRLKVINLLDGIPPLWKDTKKEANEVWPIPPPLPDVFPSLSEEKKDAEGSDSTEVLCD